MKTLFISIIILLLVQHKSFSQGDSITNNIFTTKKFRYGIFQSYEEFRLNQPGITEGFYSKPDFRGGSVDLNTNYYEAKYKPNQVGQEDLLPMAAQLFFIKKNKKISRAFAFSDGKYLYINSSLYQNYSSYYLRVLESGKIIYFRDTRMNKAHNISTGFALFGIAGALVGSEISDGQPDGVILFENDKGMPYELDKTTLTSILKETDTELYNQYKLEPLAKIPMMLQRYVILYNRRNTNK